MVSPIQSLLNSSPVINVEKAITPVVEPQRSYMWEVSIQGLHNRKLTFNPNPIFYAKSISIPASSLDMITDKFLGETYYHVGPDSSPKTLNITFWDDQSLTVYLFLQSWYDMGHSQGGTAHSNAGRSAGNTFMQALVSISLKDTTDFVTILSIDFPDTMISGIEDVALDYGSSGELTVSASFVYNTKIVGGIVNSQNRLAANEPANLVPGI